MLFRSVPKQGSIEEPAEIIIRTAPGYPGILETPKTPTISARVYNKIVIEESKLLMETSAGKKQINVLPEDAIKISETPAVEMIKAIELKEESQSPIYSIKGIKKARLLFIFPVNLKIETKVSAETGSVISVKRPWWIFLAW